MKVTQLPNVCFAERLGPTILGIVVALQLLFASPQTYAAGPRVEPGRAQERIVNRPAHPSALDSRPSTGTLLSRSYPDLPKAALDIKWDREIVEQLQKISATQPSRQSEGHQRFYHDQADALVDFINNYSADRGLISIRIGGSDVWLETSNGQISSYFHLDESSNAYRRRVFVGTRAGEPLDVRARLLSWFDRLDPAGAWADPQGPLARALAKVPVAFEETSFDGAGRYVGRSVEEPSLLAGPPLRSLRKTCRGGCPPPAYEARLFGCCTWVVPPQRARVAGAMLDRYLFNENELVVASVARDTETDRAIANGILGKLRNDAPLQSAESPADVQAWFKDVANSGWWPWRPPRRVVAFVGHVEDGAYVLTSDRTGKSFRLQISALRAMAAEAGVILLDLGCGTANSAPASTVEGGAVITPSINSLDVVKRLANATSLGSTLGQFYTQLAGPKLEILVSVAELPEQLDKEQTQRIIELPQIGQPSVYMGSRIFETEIQLLSGHKTMIGVTIPCSKDNFHNDPTCYQKQSINLVR